jgi:BASS family bile acid:Na+ symporter
VLLMPFAVPLLIEGLTVSAWAIAKPLVVLVVMPLVMGVGIQILWPSVASRIQPFVKKGTGIDTILMLVLVVIIYGKGFLGSIGSYASGTQAVFFLVITAGSYALGFGMPRHQKSVVSLGLCTRNCGAAMAPLFVAADVDQSAIVMVTLGIPMMFISALIAARIFGARAGQPVAQPA